MKAKFYIKASLILLILISFGCDYESPMEVDANRVIDYTELPTTGTQDIILDNYKLYFGYVSRYGKESMGLRITNVSNKPVRIESGDFISNSLFSIDGITFPFILEPKGDDKSSKFFQVTFQATNLGLFRDTLTFNGQDEPFVELFSTVPDVTANDVNFGPIFVNVLDVRSLSIMNHSNTMVTIYDFKIEDDPNRVFALNIDLPLKIPSVSHKNLLLTFKPNAAKEFKATIKFTINANGFKDDEALITGYGINN